MIIVKATVKLNRASIQKKIEMAMAKKSDPIARTKAFGIFQRAKRKALQDFDNHPVTIELRNGPSSFAVTGATNGYGNLFAFLGFSVGTDPTENLRQLLESCQIHRGVLNGKVWKFSYDVPTKRAIAVNSPMPWETGNSFVEEIEAGTVSNLSYFLFQKFNSPEPSESSMGIQSKYEVNQDLSFQKTPYLTEILKNFRERADITV